MKISKFLWSVLVTFATVALIAPQQVEAIVVDGRINGQIKFTGSGTITSTITIINTITTLTIIFLFINCIINKGNTNGREDKRTRETD